MNIKNISLRNKATYGPMSSVFHWTMAIIFFCQSGLTAALFLCDDGLMSDLLKTIHQQLGFVLFSLAFARGIWGVLNIGQYPPTYGLSGRLIVDVLMLVVPSLALLLSLEAEYRFSVLWLEVFTSMSLVATPPNTTFDGLHSLLAWILMLAVSGRSLIAIFHRFVLRDNARQMVSGHHKNHTLRSQRSGREANAGQKRSRQASPVEEASTHVDRH